MRGSLSYFHSLSYTICHSDNLTSYIMWYLFHYTLHTSKIKSIYKYMWEGVTEGRRNEWVSGVYGRTDGGIDRWSDWWRDEIQSVERETAANRGCFSRTFINERRRSSQVSVDGLLKQSAHMSVPIVSQVRRFTWASLFAFMDHQWMSISYFISFHSNLHVFIHPSFYISHKLHVIFSYILSFLML